MQHEPHGQTGPCARALSAALLELDADGVAIALDRGLRAVSGDHARLADDVVAPVLTRLGQGWECGDVALSQLYMAGRLLERAMERLAPGTGPGRTSPRIGIGVLGDHHTLGKRIVMTTLRLAGFPVVDLGAGLRPGEVVEQARAEHLDVVMISVLMMHHALTVGEVAAGLCDLSPQPLLVVGGAPFVHDPELWRRVGAHTWGRSAADALRIATERSRACAEVA